MVFMFMRHLCDYVHEMKLNFLAFGSRIVMKIVW
jgi:hypothetical protein